MPLIDAWDWMPDECFADMHHLTAEGSARFSRKLAEATGLPVKRQPLVAAARPPRPSMPGIGG